MVESAEQFIVRKSQEWETTRGQPKIRTKDIGRRGFHRWRREAWTFHIQHNLPQKVFVFERLRHFEVSGEQAYSGGARCDDIEYRIGYYMVGRNGRAVDRWTWGQFCPFVPVADWDILLQKARAEGTLLSAKST